MDIDASVGILTVSRGSPGISQKNCAPQHDLSVALERNEVFSSLSPASSRRVILACSHCMRQRPRGGTPQQALAHSKFISSLDIHIHGRVLSRHTSRVYGPAGCDLERHASRFSCAFLSTDQQEKKTYAFQASPAAISTNPKARKKVAKHAHLFPSS